MIYKIFIKLFRLRRTFEIYSGKVPFFIRIGDCNDLWFFSPFFALSVQGVKVKFFSSHKVKLYYPKDLHVIWYRLNPMFIVTSNSMYHEMRANKGQLKGFLSNDYDKNIALPSWVFNHISVYKCKEKYYISISDDSFGGYGHYILDILPAIINIHKVTNASFFMDKNTKYGNLFIDSCKLFKIDCQDVDKSDADFKLISIKDLIAIGIYITRSFSYYPGYLKTALVLNRLPRQDCLKKPFRKLYIVRSQLCSAGRIINNEDILVEWLKKKNFEIIQPESLSIHDQFKLFREAELVVGVSGSALLNAIFMSSGSTILEITPVSDFRHGVVLLASIIGIKYFYFSGLHDANQATIEDKPENFSVDMQLLMSKIGKLQKDTF